MNNEIFFFFNNFIHQSDFIDSTIFFFAEYFIYFVIIFAFVLVCYCYKPFFFLHPIREFLNKWKEFILLAISVVSAWGLAKILKILIHTPRPFDIFTGLQTLFIEPGYAFPSGHTAVSSAVGFVLFFTYKKVGLPAWVSYLFIFSSLLIGVARVASGVHFPVDILGGFVLGAIVALIVVKVGAKFFKSDF